MLLMRFRTMQESKFCTAANIIQAELHEFERITLVLHLSADRLNVQKLKEHVSGNLSRLAMGFE